MSISVETSPNRFSIPPQYDGMHSKVVADLLSKSSVFIDSNLNDATQIRNNEIIKELQRRELEEANQMSNLVANSHAELTDDQKRSYPESQQVAGDFLSDILRQKIDIPEGMLTTAEYLLIKELQEKQNTKDYEDINVTDELSDIDALTFSNLHNRLALDIVTAEPGQVSKETTTEDDTNDFANFSQKSGETAEGYFWHSFENKAAKKMKESGEFEWGKERIYFDVNDTELKKLSTLISKIAAELDIPIAYKYLDTNKSFAYVIEDVSTTRFVANFATVNDAKVLLEALSSTSEYNQLNKGSGVNYNGYKIDGIATYANGYREKRGALERIVNAKPNNNGTAYSYPSEDGNRTITITSEQYNDFVSMYNNLPTPENSWNQAR